MIGQLEVLLSLICEEGRNLLEGQVLVAGSLNRIGQPRYFQQQVLPENILNQHHQGAGDPIEHREALAIGEQAAKLLERPFGMGPLVLQESEHGLELRS